MQLNVCVVLRVMNAKIANTHDDGTFCERQTTNNNMQHALFSFVTIFL